MAACQKAERGFLFVCFWRSSSVLCSRKVKFLFSALKSMLKVSSDSTCELSGTVVGLL